MFTLICVLYLIAMLTLILTTSAAGGGGDGVPGACSNGPVYPPAHLGLCSIPSVPLGSAFSCLSYISISPPATHSRVGLLIYTSYSIPCSYFPYFLSHTHREAKAAMQVCRRNIYESGNKCWRMLAQAIRTQNMASYPTHSNTGGEKDLSPTSDLTGI